MKTQYRERILAALEAAGRRALFPRELAKSCGTKADAPAFKDAVNGLLADGTLLLRRGRFVSAQAMGLFPARIGRVSRTFGFLTAEDGTEMFVAGRNLLGAMPEDEVLAKRVPSRGESPEAEVVSVTKRSPSRFTGVVVEQGGMLFLLPDKLSKSPFAIVPDGMANATVGDKVFAEIAVRGKRHSEHQARILAVYGQAGRASVCADAILDENGVPAVFSSEASAEADMLSARGIPEKELDGRADLRELPIFTIDGADAKDLDDAVSIAPYQGGYLLGVHIADVSHYVRTGSALDKEAFARGTSIYFADRVIPMLPEALSNGICSLHPGVDRLTFTVFLHVDADGQLLDFEFHKSVIRSRVKGVYAEINTLWSERNDPALTDKYAEVLPSLTLMHELADILYRARMQRGAPQIDTSESKIVLDTNGVPIDILARERGRAEIMIEDFMLMANQAAATLAREQALPFVYRVHEDPSPERIETLYETMRRLGLVLPGKRKNGKTSPKQLSEILDKARGRDIFPIVNRLVLRSMAKAKYAAEPIGHFGLSLADYAHFTSPIRRYPDLTIHRILTDYVGNVPAAKIQSRYATFAAAAASRSSETELRAMRCERDCEDCYKAEYMQAHLDEEFDGVISSVVEHGIYVELPNTVEGLIRVEALPSGQYEYDGLFELRERRSEHVYRVGGKARVRCVAADVDLGRVDFALVE